MNTTRYYIIDSNNTEHTRAVFGILPLSDNEPFDFEAKAITSKITVIKEAAFDKSKFPPNTDLVIVECLQRDIVRQDANTITLRWGGNIAHITTAGEYDPENRRKWHSEFRRDLHSPR